jgi:hypothetical protein
MPQEGTAFGELRQAAEEGEPAGIVELEKLRRPR